MASKKGFDKEYIFNLIMPTAPGEEELEPEEQPAAPPQPQEPEEEQQPAAQDSLSLLREKLSQPVDLMEQLVADRLDAVFEKFNCCRCDKCRRDVAALALNTIPPQYVVAEPEEIPALLAAAPTKDIPGALVKAILQIKGNPQH